MANRSFFSHIISLFARLSLPMGVLVSIALTVIGCSPVAPPQSPQIADVYPSTLAPQLHADIQTPFKIEDSAKDAPGAVGHVIRHQLIGDMIYGGHCSGTLVAANVVLTNSHCIPDAVKNDPSLCQMMHFRAKGNPTTLATCKKILYYSGISSRDAEGNKSKERGEHYPKNLVHSYLKQTLQEPDYALFEIDQDLKVTPAKIAMKGLENYKTYSSYPVNPKDFLKGTMVAKKITMRLHSTGIGSSEDPLTLTGNMSADIAVIKGNSGTAIFNEQNEIVGVIQGTFDFMKEFTEPNTLVKFPLSPLRGQMTSLTCLDLSVLETYLGAETPKNPEACASLDLSADKLPLFPKEINEYLYQAVVTKLKDASVTLSPLFGYRYHFIRNKNPARPKQYLNYTLNVVPFCYNHPEIDAELRHIDGLKLPTYQVITVREIQVDEYLKQTFKENQEISQTEDVVIKTKQHLVTKKINNVDTTINQFDISVQSAQGTEDIGSCQKDYMVNQLWDIPRYLRDQKKEN